MPRLKQAVNMGKGDQARDQAFDQALLEHWHAAVERAAAGRSDYPFCPGQMHWRAVLDAAAQVAEAERPAVSGRGGRTAPRRRSPSTPTAR